MQWWAFLVPAGLVSAGAYLKGRDKNNTGADDAFGEVLIQAAPGISAALEGNEKALVKVMRVMNQVTGSFLATIDNTPSVSSTE